MSHPGREPWRPKPGTRYGVCRIHSNGFGGQAAWFDAAALRCLPGRKANHLPNSLQPEGWLNRPETRRTAVLGLGAPRRGTAALAGDGSLPAWAVAAHRAQRGLSKAATIRPRISFVMLRPKPVERRYSLNAVTIKPKRDLPQQPSCSDGRVDERGDELSGLADSLSKRDVDPRSRRTRARSFSQPACTSIASVYEGAPASACCRAG